MILGQVFPIVEFKDGVLDGRACMHMRFHFSMRSAKMDWWGLCRLNDSVCP